jgi:hypothetical protein
MVLLSFLFLEHVVVSHFIKYFLSFLTELGGKCSWGKIPINLLASSLENCVNLSLGHTSKLASVVTMSPSFLEVCEIYFLIVVYYLEFIVLKYVL